MKNPNALYTRARTPGPTSQAGAEAARRRKERELNRLEAERQKERDFRAIRQHEAAVARDREQQLGVQVTASNIARANGLDDKQARILANRLENARRTFRPSAEHRQFDAYAEADRALVDLKGAEHIRRNRSELTREERVKEDLRDPYAKLGLQNPAFPSIPSGMSS